MKNKIMIISIVQGMLLFSLIGITPARAQTVKKAGKAPLKTKPAVKKPSAAELQEGQQLLSKSDCLACHKTDIKLVGPAYIDVAKKYPGTEESYHLLSAKVIKGGAGVWGQTSMPPHPTLDSTEARKIVKYILSIK